MATPDPTRHRTLQILLDRRDALETALEVANDEEERDIRAEIRRVRELLSTYCGRSNPARDMFTPENE